MKLLKVLNYLTPFVVLRFYVLALYDLIIPNCHSL